MLQWLVKWNNCLYKDSLLSYTKFSLDFFSHSSPSDSSSSSSSFAFLFGLQYRDTVGEVKHIRHRHTIKFFAFDLIWLISYYSKCVRLHINLSLFDYTTHKAIRFRWVFHQSSISVKASLIFSNKCLELCHCLRKTTLVNKSKKSFR